MAAAVVIVIFDIRMVGWDADALATANVVVEGIVGTDRSAALYGAYIGRIADKDAVSAAVVVVAGVLQPWTRFRSGLSIAVPCVASVFDFGEFIQPHHIFSRS